MPGDFRARLFAAALFVPATIAVIAIAPQPALAQSDHVEDGAVSFRTFHDRLAPYGRWFESDRWGYVWQPEDVDSNFRPYYYGHWVNTDRYGWYWVSDEVWGDIVYHYGRWVYDRDDGWLWIPGYVWAPAWVIWREGEGSTGWFPMPPDDNFFAGDESWRDDWTDYAADDYGYRDWYGPAFAATFFTLWTFVDDDHFGERDFHRYVRHRRHHDARENRDFFGHTHDATRYTKIDNFVVNRGIDPEFLRRRTGRRIESVPLRDIVRPNGLAPTRIDLGHRVRRREIKKRPDFAPRWFRERAPHTGPRFPWKTGPQKRQPRAPRNQPSNLPRVPGARTPLGAPAVPGHKGAKPAARHDRFGRKQSSGGAVGGFIPTTPTKAPPVTRPKAPAVTRPKAPARPVFQQRGNVPATAKPLPPREPKRFERIQRPGNSPHVPPAQHFDRYKPPPAPATHAPTPPPPAPAANPPSREPATRHGDHNARERPHGD